MFAGACKISELDAFSMESIQGSEYAFHSRTDCNDYWTDPRQRNWKIGSITNVDMPGERTEGLPRVFGNIHSYLAFCDEIKQFLSNRRCKDSSIASVDIEFLVPQGDSFHVILRAEYLHDIGKVIVVCANVT